MGQVDRHLQTVSYKGAGDSITNAHLEHGTITGVTATGRYKTFDQAFGGVPDVVCYEITGSNASRLKGTAAAGSFAVKLTTAGTVDLMFHAWGVR